MSDWDGQERRTPPVAAVSEARLREILQAELNPIRKCQADIQRKIAQWEFGAAIFRWFILATVGLFTAAAGVWDWTKEHIK